MPPCLSVLYTHYPDSSSTRIPGRPHQCRLCAISDLPAAVLRPVALRVVDAIQRMLRGRASAYVFEKYLKGIFPLRAHGDAATAVSSVAITLGIQAPLEHLHPSIVLGSSTHSVFGKAKPAQFFMKAAAASGNAANQIPHNNGHGISTRAATQPKGGFRLPSYRLQRCEPSKLLLGKLPKRHTAIMYRKLNESKQL